MRRNILIAAILLILLSLVGCEKIANVIDQNKNATTGDKIDGNTPTPSQDGAQITLVSSSDTSLTVKIDNDTESTWQSGNMRDYRLDVMRDGEWYEVKQIGEYANTMELMLFTPGQTLTHTFEFTDRYGKLPSGEYRVVKSFWANATETEEAHEFYLICEFTVE